MGMAGRQQIQVLVTGPVALCLAVLLFPTVTLATSPVDNTDSNFGHHLVDRWDIYHPLDEGLWADLSSSQTASTIADNETEVDVLQEEDVTINDALQALRNHLRLAEIDSLRLFSKPPLSHHNGGVMKPMTYTIFQEGQSALRALLEEDSSDRDLVYPERLFGGFLLPPSQPPNLVVTPAHYRVCAALLLLRGHSDAAHEMLLGVTPQNIKEGEYAASHRGKTDWAAKHPLTDSADMLHAAMHRLVEGDDLGEGDQTGYENAKYWLAGGPKKLPSPAPHPVRDALARIAREHTPRCVSSLEGKVIASSPEGAKHTILAGGGKGKTRTVCVPCGQWDDFAFLELCQQWAAGMFDNDQDMEDEVATLQRAEIILLLRHELLVCLTAHRLQQKQAFTSTATTKSSGPEKAE